MLTSVANASAATQTAYNAWKSMFVTSNGAGSALRVNNPQTVNCNGTNVSGGTVSEGIGYGMIAAVYMADRPTFDGLWNYAKGHMTPRGLMNWCINNSGGTVGNGSATDADEDMAFALLMASNQWSSVAYLDAGRAIINAMYGNSLSADGTLRPGDAWGGTVVYPDYFSPAYFRVFAKATNNNEWTGIIMDRQYQIVNDVSGTYGLVPDSTDVGKQPPYPTTNPYGYDACRMPWRIAMDYCFNGEPRAKAYLDKIGPFFNGMTASNIGDRYNTSGGGPTSSNHNMAFIGTAGVAGMAGWPTLLNGAFTFGVNGAGDNAYFTHSLRVVTMLMMSGNLIDYTQL
jgi:endo-1,4-beta-D-glucanase Y